MLIRKGPKESAKNYRVGHKMKGQDGNIWLVKTVTNKNGLKYNRWFKIIKLSPKKVVNPKIVKPNMLRNGNDLFMTFRPLFYHNKNDNLSLIEFYQLPEKVKNEVIKYAMSDAFVNKLYKELSYIENDNYLHATILKVEPFNDIEPLIYVQCKLKGSAVISVKEYEKDISNMIYKASYSGTPFIVKYGKYLGKGKNRYEIYFDKAHIIKS